MRLLMLLSVVTVLALVAGPSTPAKEPSYPPSPHVAGTEPRKPEEERRGFHLPDGFEAQLVAAEPDIHKPINMAFDARGRLWVTESVEYPFAARDGAKARDKVKILEDFGPDGRARKVTMFANHLNIPIGVLPYRDGAIVYSIPNIWRLTDTRGSGKADKREVLYGVYEHRDTHGMTGEFTLGIDGWIYACHGFANTSTVRGADGSQITMNSGNTYRFRPDGSRVEYVTHGQVNPFGLTWDPLGNLYSCDCHSQPIYQLLKGAYYPSFGKPDDGLGFGPEMFTNYQDSTAIAGIAYYAADHFPAGYRDCAFIGDVVTNRIVQFDIAWHGSSPKASMKYFLKSDDPWFRPVSIVLGPDGALYVADFYNRIIGHYEVPLNHPGRDRTRGRIWRIVYRGKDGRGKAAAPRSDWTKAKVRDLVRDLGHPNLSVRLIATQQLAQRDKAAVDEEISLAWRPRSRSRGYMRAHALWVLERHGLLDDDFLAYEMGDNDRLVRVHVLRIVAGRKKLSPLQEQRAVAALKDRDPFVQRAAAEALGSHPSADHVAPLVALRQAVPAEDTHLLHVVRMALRDQLVPDATWERLSLDKWSKQDRGVVADVCLGVPTSRAAQYLLVQMGQGGVSSELLYRSVHHVARYGNGQSAGRLLERVTADQPANLMHQRNLFLGVQQGIQERGGQLPRRARAWGEALAGKLVASNRKEEFLAGLELGGALRARSLRSLLVETGLRRSEAADRRVAALNALAASDAGGAVPTLGKVLGNAAEPVGVREQVAGVLGKINQPAAQEELLKALPTAPAGLQNVMAGELARSRAGAEKLLEAVAAGKASARVLQEKVVELRLRETGLPNLRERVKRLTAGLPTPDRKMQELLQGRRVGFLRAKTDVGRGAKVFTTHCANCHQLGGQGTKVGPQLDGVGIRGLDRLLEDTLDPNRNVDQAFRLTTLTLNSGKIESGLLLREEGQVYVLADSKGKEVRVAKKDVESRTVSQISPMPADFAVQIGEGDYYDLLAYLLTQKVAREEGKGAKKR
jgi:putative heme-binding domain-containing protein